MIAITIDEAARDMVDDLQDAAKVAGVSLEGVTYDNFNLELDTRFHDGGEARCERFLDHGDDYALQFGPLDSAAFDEAKHRLIRHAFALLRRRLG